MIDVSIFKGNKINLIDKFILFIAFGFGTGCLRPAPGTWGTLPGLAFAYFLMPYGVWSFVLLIILFLLGIYCCNRASKVLRVHDFGGIVIDEIVGIMITLSVFDMSWQTLVLGFVGFRLFDIVKPWPIKWLDKHVEGGFGIMVDDVLAGLFAIPFVYLGLLIF